VEKAEEGFGSGGILRERATAHWRRKLLSRRITHRRRGGDHERIAIGRDMCAPSDLDTFNPRRTCVSV